jgi:hypothetical protein
MASIVIRNIGPLADTGIVELKQFNIVIGRQSTGKSTFMKILCFCKWIEKRIMTKDGDEKILSIYTHGGRFLNELMQFHRINETAFSNLSEIHFIGDCISIDLVGYANPKITRLKDFDKLRYNTKLSFIPSERNLVSAIRNVDRAYRSNDYDVLFNHVFEWGEAKESYTANNPINLKLVEDMEYYYDHDAGDVILLKDKYVKMSPFYASSGVQSALPIMVMVDYFTGPIFDKSADINRRDVAGIFKMLNNKEIDNIAEVRALYSYRASQLFIEEPEQNLFPGSQQTLINYIAKSINRATKRTGSDSSMTLTTHSPYILTAFNVLLLAYKAKQFNERATGEVIDVEGVVSPDKLVAYYITDKGTFKNIMDHEIGMISGLELDEASDVVEDKLSMLNDIIYG